MPSAVVATQVNLDLVFKALASEQRREILAMLSEHTGGPCAPGCATEAADEVCACKIAEHLGLAASTISHHTALLRESGLVGARKDGLWVHYSLRRDVLEAAAEALKEL